MAHKKRISQNQFTPSIQTLEMPLWLLPDLTWFQQALQANTILIDDTAPFQKQTLLSRYAIGGPNNIQWLSIPIQHHSRGLPLADTTIDYHQSWVKDHKQAWQTAYGKTPFFEFYDHRFFQIFDAHILSLADLSWELLQLLHLSLNLPNRLIRKSTLPPQKSYQTDHLNQPIPNAEEFPFFTLPYPQIFDIKHGFRYPLSAIDYLFQNYPNF